MKTTLEIPDALFRQAKARAAERGIPLRELVTNAVRRELHTSNDLAEKRAALHELAGGLRHLKADNKRLRAVIEKEFGAIEPEEWA